MSVYFFNRDPNNIFPAASSYSKDDVDQLFSGLTTDGVTQSAMTYAIEDFISVTEINNIMSDYTVNYISDFAIFGKFSTATADFWTSDEIDSVLSGDTSYYLNEDEINAFASGRTAQYPITEEVYDNAYNATEVSQLYWHPAPFYKRTLLTDDTTYTLGGSISNTTTIDVSANIYWEVEEIGGGEGQGQSTWYSLSQSTGDTSATITVTAEENNNSGNVRIVNLGFSGVQIDGVPFTVTLTQIEGIVD